MNGEQIINSLPPEVLAKLNADATEKLAADKAAKEANAIPLPGAAAALLPAQDVIVKTTKGNLTFRPFYDYDFKVLQMVEHPLYKKAIGGDDELSAINGEHCWVLAWLLSRPVKEVRPIAKRGKEAVLDAATDAFGEYQLGDIAALSKAAFEQVGQYFSTALALEAAEQDGESKKN